MKSLMILIATLAMTLVTVQAENIHPAVEKAMAMETNAPAPAEGNTTEEAPEKE